VRRKGSEGGRRLHCRLRRTGAEEGLQRGTAPGGAQGNVRSWGRTAWACTCRRWG
jgi:hypothetical protein